MPIQLPKNLPAEETLRRENISVMPQNQASASGNRPLEIVLLNLMPTKIATETQFARLLGSAGHCVNLTLMYASTHVSKNVSQEHLQKFYKTFDDLKDRKFDGLIITGAPVELIEFEEVDYWPELCDIMEWSKTNIRSTMHICWGAQAGLYYHYGIQKYQMPEKLFGVYPHTADHKHEALLQGFDDVFWVPHSRHTTIRREDIQNVPELKILVSSKEAGVHAIMSKDGRQFFVTGHSEYDAETLCKEYLRDKNKGLPIRVPENYFPNDDDTQPPVMRWREHAKRLFSNWLQYFVVDPV